MELYRYEGNYYTGTRQANLNLNLRRFKVVKETPCGYWIELWENGDRKLCLKGAARSYAHITEQEALFSLIKRKQMQEAIIKSQLLIAKEVEKKAREEYTIRYGALWN